VLKLEISYEVIIHLEGLFNDETDPEVRYEKLSGHQ
jgi:hypothetical protein